MVPEELVSSFWCPTCRTSGLTAECTSCESGLGEGVLRCDSCSAEYPLVGGIPDLRPKRAVSDAIATWEGHLEGLERRRAVREPGPNNAQDRRWGHKLAAFAAFVAPRVAPGRLLDVGCGPGNLRMALDPSRVRYHGLDPLPLPEVEAFPFARGLAESIPFRDGTFSAVVVRSALDHFIDLRQFFREALRVLDAGGALFVEQVVHGDPGVAGLVQNALHSARDWLDSRRTSNGHETAPKHMREFSRGSLIESTRELFLAERIETYRPRWYTPTQMFIELRPCARA